MTWTLVDQWARQIVNVAVFIIIARLVAPDEIGLVALAWVFVVFAQIFVDVGIGDALVQRALVTRQHLDTAFWTSLAAGTLLAALGIGVAPLLSTILSEPRLTPMLQATFATLVLSALASVQLALLRRELALRSLAIRNLVSIFGGAIAGVTLAYHGYGAWALVGQYVTALLLSVATLWWLSPYRPGLNLSRRHMADLVPFALHITGSDIVDFVSRRSDNLLVGSYLGAAPLGFYAVGYRILDSSHALLGGLALRVAFPAFSILQASPERLRNALMRINRLSGAVALPSFVALAVVASELVEVMFGPRWEGSAMVAAILFLGGAADSVTNISGAAFNGTGHPHVAFKFRFVSMVANIIGFFVAVAVFGNIVAVAAAYALRAYVLLPLNLHWLGQCTGLSVARLCAGLSGIVVATLMMAGGMLLLRAVIGPWLAVEGVLVVQLLVGFVTYTTVLALMDRLLVVDIFRIGIQVLDRRANDCR